MRARTVHVKLQFRVTLLISNFMTNGSLSVGSIYKRYIRIAGAAEITFFYRFDVAIGKILRSAIGFRSLAARRETFVVKSREVRRTANLARHSSALVIIKLANGKEICAYWYTRLTWTSIGSIKYKILFHISSRTYHTYTINIISLYNRESRRYIGVARLPFADRNIAATWW